MKFQSSTYRVLYIAVLTAILSSCGVCDRTLGFNEMMKCGFVDSQDSKYSLLSMTHELCVGLNNDRCRRALFNNVSWKGNIKKSSYSEVITYYEFQIDGTWQMYLFFNIDDQDYFELRGGDFVVDSESNEVILTKAYSSCSEDAESIFHFYDNNSLSYYVSRSKDTLTVMDFSLHPNDLQENTTKSINIAIVGVMKSIMTLMFGVLTDQFWVDLWQGPLTSGHSANDLPSAISLAQENCFTESEMAEVETSTIELPTIPDLNDIDQDLIEDILDEIGIDIEI
ncbi:hypothetical protein N9W79_02060 [bacterium]|nr:hypothetical protein [bacterium]